MPGKKPLGAKERTNNKLNPHMASTPVFDLGPHWWEASALTTAPSLAHLLSAIRSAHVLPPFILSPKKRRKLLGTMLSHC